MPLQSGDVFAGYRILRVLGSGGMGEVYLAQHPRLPRRDALKILPSPVSADEDFRRRFEREADLASALWHPNIVGVHDRGEFDGQLWISMDYVDGLDAARLLTQSYPSGMPADLVVKIVAAVAAALDYAHDQELLHRDVKPANVMLTHVDPGDQQRVLLADFGIARNINDISGLTATNMTVGTVAYCAPEQLLGEDIDGRADQYALAATAYHLLTGSHLFPHSNPAVVISRHLSAAPPALADTRADLAGLDPVVAVALAKNPRDRFRRCSDFARALAEQASAHSASSPVAVTKAATVSPKPTGAPRGKAAYKRAKVASRSVTTPSKPTTGPPRSTSSVFRPPTTDKQPKQTPEFMPRREAKTAVIAGAISLVGAIVAVAVATVAWVVLKPAPSENVTAPHKPTDSSTQASTGGPSPLTPNTSSISPVTTFAAPAPDPNRPLQGNCPPACTQIPDSAWIDPSTIPLYASYRWAPLAPLSEPVSGTKFLADELCAAGPQDSDERAGAITARIILPNPPGQWQLQVQILHWRGDPWIAGQRASAVMDAAVSLLRDKCSFAAPGVSVTRIAEQNVPGGNPGQSLTATITEAGSSSRVAHIYLISDLRNSTVVELALSSASPPVVEWPHVNDDQLLAAMVTPLCTAYVNSCAT